MLIDKTASMKKLNFLFLALFFVVACNNHKENISIEVFNSLEQRDADLDDFIIGLNEFGNLILAHDNQYVEDAFQAIDFEKLKENSTYFTTFISENFNIGEDLVTDLQKNYSVIENRDEEALNLQIQNRYKLLLASGKINLKNYKPNAINFRACSCSDLSLDFVITSAITLISCGACAEGAVWNCPGCVQGGIEVYNLGVQMANCACFS